MPSVEIPRMSQLFMADDLGHDGVFILRLIEINHGSAILTHLVAHLYSAYQQSQLPRESRATSSIVQGPRRTIVPPQVGPQLHPQFISIHIFKECHLVEFCFSFAGNISSVGRAGAGRLLSPLLGTDRKSVV